MHGKYEVERCQNARRRRKRALRPPAIILVEPQLGENIGQAARAMANFGLEELRLVAPRDGWPNEKAIAGASGARRHHRKGDAVFSTIGDAIADLHYIGATTARIREMVKPVTTPESAARDIAERSRRRAALRDFVRARAVRP